MGAPPRAFAPPEVNILVLDDDARSQAALRQILDSDRWRVCIVPDTKLLVSELKTGEWSLVIADVTLTGLESLLFVTLRELASVPVEEGGCVRVLYLVPEMAGSQYVDALEQAGLPYVVRPYHLHDFLEKVSELLVEIKAISAPLRQVRREFGNLRKKTQAPGRSTAMFASRDSSSYSDEEIAEYEQAESEASNARRNKPRPNLGDPHR